MSQGERERRIAELAHRIWEAEGRPDGQAQRHWAMAERLIEASEHVEALPGAARERLDQEPGEDA
jgi:DUF2934 family protein